MRRFSLLFVILGCIAIACLLTWMVLSAARFGTRPPRAVVAGGASSTATQALPPFRRIDVAGTATITLVQGTAESIALPATPGKGNALDADVRNGTLYLEAADNTRWWDWLLGRSGRAPAVVITFKDLESIATAGGVRISAREIKVPALRISGAGGTQVTIEDLATGQLRLTGAGALKADLAGTADVQNVTITGAGDYRGGKLVSQDATVTVAGAGKVVVNAQKTLKATISGAGSVEYLGNPDVTKNVSGAGSVRRREAGGTGSGVVALAQ
jgi:hypothetical protein